MFTSLIARPWIARSALLSLVLGSVLVGSTPANATGLGPIAPQAITFNRNSDDSTQLSIKDGESMNITSVIDVTSDWAGWPLKKGAKLTRTPFVATLPSPLVASYDQWRYWNGYNMEDQECEGVWDVAPGHTMTSPEICIDSLNVVDNLSVDNNSGGTKIIRTNTLKQVLKNGKTVLSGKEGVNSSLVGEVTVHDDSATTVDGEDSVSLSFRGCIDEDLLNTSGEDLTVEVIVARGGTPLERSVDYDLWSSSDYTDTDTDPDVVTYAAPSEADFGGKRENLEVQIDAYIYDSTPGVYSGTLDVTNGSDQSVLEECPSDNVEPSFPAQIARLEYGAQPAMTFSSEKPLPTQLVTKDDFSLYSSSADGFGGLFYLTYASDPYASGTPPMATIVHMSSTGADNGFNDGTGKLSTSVGRDGQLDIGRYDANGTKWFTVAPTGTGWSIQKGSMTTGAATTTTISSKILTKLCPAKYKPFYLSGISAPTVNPMASLLCVKGQQISNGIVSLTPSGAALVRQLGSATTASPCVIPQIGMNPSASAGTDIALAVYTRTSSRSDDEYGSCGAAGATTTARAITTITQAGVAVTTSVSGNPWGGDEPGSADLAPVNDQGTSWIGISTTAEYNGDPSSPDYAFTISNATTSPALSVVSDVVTFDHDFGQWAWVRPLAWVSDSSWLVAIQGETSFDGDTASKYAVSVFDVTTGQITDGHVGTMSGYGSWVSGRIASTLSVKSGKSDGASWYVLPNDENYYAFPWTYSID